MLKNERSGGWPQKDQDHSSSWRGVDCQYCCRGDIGAGRRCRQRANIAVKPVTALLWAAANLSWQHIKSSKLGILRMVADLEVLLND